MILNRTALATTFVCFIAALYGLWVLLDLPVKKYIVGGDLTQLEQAKVSELLADSKARRVLSSDLGEVGALLRDLGWARDIRVRRQWPETIVVSLTRERPVASWGSSHYVTANGDLMTLADEYLDIPRFDVVISQPRRAMEVYRLLQQVSGREELKIKHLRQNLQGGWKVEFESGLQVALGSQHINQRMHRFLLLYRRVLAHDVRDIEYVDARYTAGVAVKYADDNPTNDIGTATMPMLVAQGAGHRSAIISSDEGN